MTDKHVDDLLADLDRALAVEPSPSVVALVRTRIAEPPSAGWFGLNWRPVLTVGAVAAAVVVAAGYFAWPRASKTPEPVQTLTLHPPDVSVAPPVRTPPSPRAAPVSTTAAVEHEPEVLVPPSQRIGLAQLAEALRDGRLNGDAIPPDGPIVLPDPIVISSVAIEPFKVDPAPPIGSGGKEIR